MRQLKDYVQWPIFVGLLAIVMTLIVTSFSFRQEHRKSNSAALARVVNNSFSHHLQMEAVRLRGLLSLTMNRENLQKLFLNGDRQALFEASMPIFTHLKNEQRLTHFSFIEPDRRCFLRVHNSEEYGDVIKRETMLNAQSRQDLSWGIELSSLGTFTLRVVQPWFADKEVIGFFEFGEEIDHVTKDVSRICAAKLIATVNKSHLMNTNLEKGQDDWNLFASSVVIDKTMAELSPEFVEYMKAHWAKPNIGHYEIKSGSLTYTCAPVALKDGTGKKVGTLFAFAQTRAADSYIDTVLMWQLFICTLVYGVLALLGLRFIDNNVISRIGQCVGFAGNLARGDLTATPLRRTKDDEIASLVSSLNSTRDGLRHLVSTVREQSQGMVERINTLL